MFENCSDRHVVDDDFKAGCNCDPNCPRVPGPSSVGLAKEGEFFLVFPNALHLEGSGFFGPFVLRGLF